MPAPAGAIVGLYYDALFLGVAVDDCLLTPSGRAYRVVAARRQIRGKHAGRWHLRAEVLDVAPPDDGSVIIHPLYWYRRVSQRRALHEALRTVDHWER